MARDPRTGVCVMRLTAGLDSGPVALRAEVPLGDDEDYGTLAPKLADARRRPAGRGARPARRRDASTFTEQDEAAVTYAEKIVGRGGASTRRRAPRTWRRRCAR